MTDNQEIGDAEEVITQIESLTSSTDLLKLTRAVQPKARVKSQYIYLDTAEKNRLQSSVYTLKWDLVFNKNLLETDVVNMRPIKNIIGMRLATIRVGYLNRGIIPLTAVNFQLSISEFGEQALLMNTIQEYPMMYHFSLYKMQKTVRSGTDVGTYTDAPYVGYTIFDLPSFVDLVCNNNGYFWFSRPVNIMPQTLSLTMYREYNKTIFPVVGATVELATQGATTTFLINGWVAYAGVAVGQKAQLTGYTITTPNAVDKAMIEYINRLEGFTITALTSVYYVGAGTTLVRATSITLALDTTTMSVVDDANGLIENTMMLFPDVSIIIPLELIYLDDEVI